MVRSPPGQAAGLGIPVPLKRLIPQVLCMEPLFCSYLVGKPPQSDPDDAGPQSVSRLWPQRGPGGDLGAGGGRRDTTGARGPWCLRLQCRPRPLEGALKREVARAPQPMGGAAGRRPRPIPEVPAVTAPPAARTWSCR